MKKIHFIYLYFLCCFVWACGGNGKQVSSLFGSVDDTETPSGTKYTFFQKNNQRKPQIGDFITFHLVVQNQEDSILQTTYGKYKQPIKELPFEEPYFIGKKYFKEVLELASEGDSLACWIQVDSLADKAGFLQNPKIKKGTSLKYVFKILKIRNKAEIKKQVEEHLKVQRELDKQLIEQYIAQLQKKDSSIRFSQTESGLYFYLKKKRQGKQAQKGDTISINYTGKLLDGTIFGKSETATEFYIGHITPTGLDEGLTLMYEGCQGIFILTSELAFGERGMGTLVPANSVVIFEVELAKIN